MAATWLAEATVIGVCGWTGLRLANGDLAAAVPLLAVSALEATRLPLSSYATQLKPAARIAACLALIGIGVLTAEVASLGFEMMIASRVADVTEARAALDAARAALARVQDKTAQLTSEANAARASLATLAGEKPALVQVKSQVCVSKHGSAYDCTPANALKANTGALAAYDSRLKRAQDALSIAQDRLDDAPNTQEAERALRASESRYRAAVAASPMTRIAAEIFGVELADLSDASFERFKGWVALSLGAAVASTTALLAFLAHLPPRDPTAETKLSRALRAWIARRRKRLIRTVDRLVERRVKEFVFVPMHDGVVTGVPRLHMAGGSKQT
jgi:hypothetical protein